MKLDYIRRGEMRWLHDNGICMSCRVRKWTWLGESAGLDGILLWPVPAVELIALATRWIHETEKLRSCRTFRQKLQTLFAQPKQSPSFATFCKRHWKVSAMQQKFWNPYEHLQWWEVRNFACQWHRKSTFFSKCLFVQAASFFEHFGLFLGDEALQLWQYHWMWIVQPALLVPLSQHECHHSLFPVTQSQSLWVQCRKGLAQCHYHFCSYNWCHFPCQLFVQVNWWLPVAPQIEVMTAMFLHLAWLNW